MPTNPTSVTLDDEIRDRVDQVAEAYDRSRSWIITRAIREFLDREEAFVRAVKEGIEAADRGDLVPHDQVMDEMDRHIEGLAQNRASTE